LGYLHGSIFLLGGSIHFPGSRKKAGVTVFYRPSLQQFKPKRRCDGFNRIFANFLWQWGDRKATDFKLLAGWILSTNPDFVPRDSQ
jgi:hypothetical protein